MCTKEQGCVLSRGVNHTHHGDSIQYRFPDPTIRFFFDTQEYTTIRFDSIRFDSMNCFFVLFFTLQARQCFKFEINQCKL